MYAKKSLGQNFLRNKAALLDMVKAGDIQEGDTVLEIGPGEGVLTAELLQAGARVIAIEKDARLIPVLQERFKEALTSKKLELREGDILLMNPKELSLQKPWKLIANIPYYITGAIMEKFLDAQEKPTCMVVMVQKEVAVRICARDGKGSILSIAVKTYGMPTLVRTVPRGSFVPPPNVDSAILAITNISSPFKTMKEQERFFEILRAGFAHKRKLLIRNLETVVEKNILEQAFKNTRIDNNVRAETLTKEQWFELSKQL